MDAGNQHREGGDIFAADMEQPELVCKISESFENSTVFLTGGTGFIGKLFLEKLLRTCKTVKVYVLVRPKKNKDTAARFLEIFEGPNMVPLKLANPKYQTQVRLIHGDCAERDLGIGEEDKQMLIKEVNFIIHCAATVRFDEHLRKAAHINVRGVKDLIAIAKCMRDLRAFLHVSTAYSHCPRKVIDETFYEAGMKGDDLLSMVEMMDDKKLADITPELIKDWPNTYAFTKAIAENVIQSDAANLPVAILRPSIVISSLSEPLAGWIDNFYGATGIFLASGLGLLRVMQGDEANKADMIPADFVSNAGFAILWDTSRKRSLNDNMEKPEDKSEDITIYNAVSSAEKPITWGEFHRISSMEGSKNASEMQLWYPFIIILQNPYVCAILTVLLHTVPAYLVDGLCFCLGKEQRLVKGYEKIHKFSGVVSYFIQRDWKFSNDNLQALWQSLDPEDRRLYPFSVKNLNWKNFMYFYVKGMRVYLLKDPLETLPKGKKKFQLLKVLHFGLIFLLAVINLAIIYFIIF